MDNPPKTAAAAVRRSACDQCRAKRVRCLRAENSLAPCARCSHIGARCVTGASGHPGRPRKQPRPVVDVDSTSTSTTTPTGNPGATPAAIISSPGRPCTSTLLQGTNSVEVHAPTMPDFWEAPGADNTFFMSSPSIDQGPATDGDFLALMDQLSSPSQLQLQGLPSADNDLNTMLHVGRDSSTALDMNVEPLLLDPWEGVVLPPSPEQPQCADAASSLMRFREEMVQRIAALDEYFSDPLQVLQGCKEEPAAEEAGNPAAMLLMCSKEFIDIIQSLTSAAHPTIPKDSYPHNQLVPPDLVAPAVHLQTEEDALSTEVVLLALSSYLALMRLYDSMFHCIYKFICQMPPGSFKSLKVKSVLRIGGVSSLQDMPLKTYATGILEVVRGQVRTLERCMGVPTEYCLSGGEPAAAPGIFSRVDRARLFRAVMAQEDVKSRRGSKSYVESIRASIQDSVAFLDV